MSRKRAGGKQENKSNFKRINIKYSLILLTIFIITIGGIYASTMPQESSSAKSWGDAPDFTLKTLEGDDFTLSDHFGKIILIDFMASWCSWCKPQMGELEEVLKEKGNEIIIVSVDVEKGETRDDLEGAFGDYLDKWTFVIDDYGQNVGSKYQVLGIPKLVIIDKEGNIYYSDSGLTQSEKLIEEIDNLNE